MADKYNGWSNWETWVTGLWFGDDDAWPEVCARGPEAAREYVEEVIETLAAGATYIGGRGENAFTGFIGDILSGFVRRVDWHEIADHFTPEEEVEEEEEDNDDE